MTKEYLFPNPNYNPEDPDSKTSVNCSQLVSNRYRKFMDEEDGWQLAAESKENVQLVLSHFGIQLSNEDNALVRIEKRGKEYYVLQSELKGCRPF